MQNSLPDPNTVGWWAMKDGEHIEFAASERFDNTTVAGNHFFDRHGFGVVFHHGNRSGLRPTIAGGNHAN
jgi:hypothetical protein